MIVLQDCPFLNFLIASCLQVGFPIGLATFKVNKSDPDP